jgi:hypothetical protein
MLSKGLSRINERYRKFVTALGFILLFKLISTVFYGSFFFFFNNLAPKWNEFLVLNYDLNIYFLKLQPYLDFSFFISSFKSPATYLGLIVFIYLFVHRKRISWKEMEIGNTLKLLFIIPGFILCWELLTYDYNYYLDNYFLLERLLMVVFLALIWVHPISAVGFLMISLLFRAQFDFPIGGFPLFDKKILFDFYVLLITFLLIRTRIKISKTWLFYFFLIVIAASYFATAIGKIRISPHGHEWFTDNPLHYLIINGSERGWVVPAHLISWVGNNKVILQFLVLFLEFLALFLLYKRRVSIIVISLLILFHFSIFYFGGILFWKWMIVDLVTIGILIFYKESLKVFTPQFFKISLFLIPTAGFWLSTFSIGWLDTKFNQTFEYTVVLENGEEYATSKNLFNPYHQVFFHDKFLYLVDDKRIKITGFGYTFKHKLSHAINASDLAELPLLERDFGKNYYSKERNEVHTNFIKTFFTNYNKYLGESQNRHLIDAPQHIYNFPDGKMYEDQGKIRMVKVYLKKTFIVDGKTQEIEKIVIKSIPISNNN